MDKLDPILKTLSRFVLIIAMTLATIYRSDVAHAHAFPIAEQPKVGSTVTTAPGQVAITFDSPIENLFAKLDVSSESGHDETAGAPAVSADHRVLSVAVKPLEPADYTVKWSVVAEDGHRTEGSFQFTVAAASQ